MWKNRNIWSLFSLKDKNYKLCIIYKGDCSDLNEQKEFERQVLFKKLHIYEEGGSHPRIMFDIYRWTLKTTSYWKSVEGCQ